MRATACSSHLPAWALRGCMHRRVCLLLQGTAAARLPMSLCVLAASHSPMPAQQHAAGGGRPWHTTGRVWSRQRRLCSLHPTQCLCSMAADGAWAGCACCCRRWRHCSTPMTRGWVEGCARIRQLVSWKFKLPPFLASLMIVLQYSWQFETMFCTACRLTVHAVLSHMLQVAAANGILLEDAWLAAAAAAASCRRCCCSKQQAESGLNWWPQLCAA